MVNNSEYKRDSVRFLKASQHLSQLSPLAICEAQSLANAEYEKNKPEMVPT